MITRRAAVNSTALNKFGRSSNVDSGVVTDIWDRANATDDQDIWTAPTEARVHDIVSTSANDAAAGTGARTVRIFGLDANWAEQQEDITLDGTSDVATANSYTRIFRMFCLTFGSGQENAGKITATAKTDSSVTAQINIAEGQTQMAIYTVPSGKTLYVYRYYASGLRAQSSGAVNLRLVTRSNLDTSAPGWLIKHTQGLQIAGTSYLAHDFTPPFPVVGPADIKLQGEGSANNMDVSAGFDGVLVDTN